MRSALKERSAEQELAGNVKAQSQQSFNLRKHGVDFWSHAFQAKAEVFHGIATKLRMKEGKLLLQKR